MVYEFLKNLLVITVFLSTSAGGFDYCTVNCGNVKHTVCEFPAGGGPECVDFKNDLSKAEKQAIVDKHNHLRWQVAIGNLSGHPSASNMLKLEWSDDAATTAQRWNEQCTRKGHDKCRNSQKNQYAGQNIASEQNSAVRCRLIILKDFVVRWYNEYVYLNPANVDKFNTVPSIKATGHYTQLVWAETSSVGCGFSVNLKLPMKSYKMTCNYIPGGNMMSAPIYKRGKACSQCPGDTKCSKKYPGLCTADKSDFGAGGFASTSRSTLFNFVITIIVSFYSFFQL